MGFRQQYAREVVSEAYVKCRAAELGEFLHQYAAPRRPLSGSTFYFAVSFLSSLSTAVTWRAEIHRKLRWIIEPGPSASINGVTDQTARDDISPNAPVRR